jgi:hypothetical protein
MRKKSPLVEQIEAGEIKMVTEYDLRYREVIKLIVADIVAAEKQFIKESDYLQKKWTGRQSS